jgi:hypothetical protein
VETSLTHFFQQQSVRARVQEWVDQGLESNPRTISYLQGEVGYPEVANLELLDRHLAGVELVKELDTTSFLELLLERTWDKGPLLQALTSLVNRLPNTPLRFRRDPSGDMPDVAEWSVRQVLRTGTPRPLGLRGRAISRMVDRIQPAWVHADALAHLEDLGLGEQIVERVVRWLLEQQIATAEGKSDSPLVTAAREVIRPSTPRDARAYADLAERLYRAHDAMLRVGQQRWLDRMEMLARAPLSPLPSLPEVLQPTATAQQLLIDGLGVTLLGPLEPQLKGLFPGWRLAEVQFAMVGSTTTTDACHRMLIEAGFEQKWEKINHIDALLHEQCLPFDEFARLALAELATACRAVRSRLDQDQPLTLFADHGFRLAEDGRSYCHGGDSTLERLVPVLFLKPR